MAAALVGAIGEALVGPLSPAVGNPGPHHDPLIAAVVQFATSALPRRQHAHQRELTLEI
jgi:hypothetical protein